MKKLPLTSNNTAPLSFFGSLLVQLRLTVTAHQRLKVAFLLLFALGFCGMSANTAHAVDYYVAAEDGNDSYNGLAPTWTGGANGPWSSLWRASQVIYGAGSRIYLKRSKVWQETLTLNGQGTWYSRNLVAPYGSGVDPKIIGTSDEAGGSVGIRTSTPDYWTIQNIVFYQNWRGIEVVLYTPGHQSLEIRNCFFWTNNAYVLRTQPPAGTWPQPAATGIQIRGSGAGVGGGADILTGVTINNCYFSQMGQSIAVGNIGHDGNNGLVRSTVISNCVMENGSFIQLAAVGAHDFTVRNTKIWNNGVKIWNGPANFVFYGVPYLTPPANQTILLVEDCEIGFNYVCDATGCSPSDGEGIELQGVTGATFRRVLFHHNDATAVLVNSPATGVQFENCVFAADEAYDVNGPASCEQYGEFRLHQPLAATFSGCRFLPRSSLPPLGQRPAVPQVPDIPKVGTCVTNWHSGITFSNTTTSEYLKETLGTNLAIGASSYQSSSPRVWGYSFSTPTTIDTVVLTETPGAGIRRFAVQYWDASTNAWKDAYNGKTIGTSSIYDRYLPFPARTTTGIRVMVHDLDWWWTVGLSGFEVYKTNGTTNPTDQFLSTTLNSNWSWVRPYGGWNLFDHYGYLRIAMDGQDLWGPNWGHPNSIVLRSTPAGDWTAVTRLQFSPAVDYQQAGLILYGDDENYLKLVFGHDTNMGGLAVEFTKESGGNPDQRLKIGVNASEIFLRLRKIGSTYSGSYSFDGVTWLTAGPDFSCPTWTRIGLLAQGPAFPYTYPDFDSFDIR